MTTDGKTAAFARSVEHRSANACTAPNRQVKTGPTSGIPVLAESELHFQAHGLCVSLSESRNHFRGGARELEESMSSEMVFAPSEDVVARTRVTAAQYAEMYARSISDPDGFWREQAQRID